MVMIYSLLWEGHHFGLLAENFQMHFKFIPSVVKIVTSITKCDRTGAMRSLTMEKNSLQLFLQLIVQLYELPKMRQSSCLAAIYFNEYSSVSVKFISRISTSKFDNNL